MGQRGPAPTPAVLRVLRGESRPSQLKVGPKPQDPPPMPDDLAPAVVKVWERVMAACIPSAHIGLRDAETFRQYCETTATINAMQPKGSKEWRELANLHRQLARELCLTPATGAHLSGRLTSERKLDRFTSTG